MLLNGTGGENDSVRVCCICFLSRKKKRGKLNFPMCKEEQAWAKKLLFRCFASKTIKHISLWRANRRQNCFASMAYLTTWTSFTMFFTQRAISISTTILISIWSPEMPWSQHNRFIIYQVVSLLSVSRSDSQWQFNICVKIGEIFFHNECFCFMVFRIWFLLSLFPSSAKHSWYWAGVSRFRCFKERRMPFCKFRKKAACSFSFNFGSGSPI